MGRSAGARNDHFDAARRRLLRIGKESIRGAMRGNDHELVGNSQLGQQRYRFLQNREIRFAASEHPDQRARTPRRLNRRM